MGVSATLLLSACGNNIGNESKDAEVKKQLVEETEITDDKETDIQEEQEKKIAQDEPETSVKQIDEEDTYADLEVEPVQKNDSVLDYESTMFDLILQSSAVLDDFDLL